MLSKASVLIHRAGLGLAATLALCNVWAQPQQPSQPAARSEARSEPRTQMPAPGADAVPIVEAREAWRRKDAARLAVLKAGTQASRHPLAMWVDYFELNHRLAQAQQGELDAFYARWPATYVEDRLRNDWLLVLGQRRDWDNFRKEFPRFRMNDDREVTCYALVSRHLAGETGMREAALAAWYAQRDNDDGCLLLGATLYESRQLTPDDIWQEARLSTEMNRPRAARAAVALFSAPLASAVGELWEQPARWLARHASAPTSAQRELAVLALMRVAAADPEAAANLMQEGGWAQRLDAAQQAHAWAAVGRSGGLRLLADAPAWMANAWAARGRTKAEVRFSDETLAWAVRAALRSERGFLARWQQVQRAIEAMSASEQRDPAWVFWRARALQALAPEGPAGDAQRQAARAAFEGLASPLGFYQKLALEETGASLALPPAPAPLTAAERDAALATPGLQRGLLLIAIGLRSEGVREWNFTLRGMDDRQLLAAAQMACEREVWDRCINTSERTRGEIDMAQRFPTPFREDVVQAASAIGLDPAYVYGLIRQESRFIMDARSHVGASGLMQLMPATARWTARKLGIDWKDGLINDRNLNLKLGTTYLKMVLDDFQGIPALAAAAYNAGPGRPRRWREGATVEPAAWAEGIPFNETRDYVKRVLSNATLYSAVMGLPNAPSLKSRLGRPVGPRDPSAPASDRELP
jgi:soluble lytic murein transglycosylase